ncbi:MAG: ketoacyl-ACP synthase III [Flavobacteriaceae bacterium]|nr:ketoacyl-ACP synthase III [Flavobacteriaceae bacterium]
MYRSRIKGCGHFLPERVIKNIDLLEFMETSDEWIQERTGIEERRWIDPLSGENTSTMGAKAAERAMKAAGVSKEEIDFIIFATLSPDMYFPGGGVRVQDILGMPTIGALDVRNQCSGFVYALSVADQFIKTGMYQNILVIGSENHSGGLEKSTRGRGVTVIFGDGAGAVVLSRSEDDSRGLLSTHLHAEGAHAEHLSLLAPNTGKWVNRLIKENNPDDTSYYPYMNGQFVFKHAVVRFSEVINEALQANGLSSSDIDLLIPHQANLRIAQFIQRKFGLNDDQVYNNIMRYGNTTAASIPIALSEAVQEGRVKKDDIIIMAAFGSGFTWASAIFRW